MSSSSSVQPCHHFSFAEIQSATNDFDDQLVIGEGGFRKVYKGCICIEETSHVVAIKRLDSMSNQGGPEFRAEIEMLSKLRHRHLVSLIGFCDDNKEMVLVYEYMPHGTLYHHLHKAYTYLNWMLRLKIAVGAAHGLDYLHTGIGSQRGVIHRDIKSSNILLDENWEAMISDFGLSKVGPINQSISYVDTSVKGTFGYLDPEYFYTRRLTRKTDVFAFGVLLFELLSGRRAVDTRFGEEQCSLVRWAQKCVKDRKLDQMVDPNIRGTISHKCLRQYVQIADRCLCSDLKRRPSMTEVVASLQVSLQLHEKHDNSAQSLSNTRFPWKLPKYLVSVTKENSVKRDGSDDWELARVARDLKKFTYYERKCATRNFETRLDHGSIVEVYKGWVDKTTYSPSNEVNGLPITVKKLYRYKHLDLDFMKELNHPNLVKLIGCCLRFQEIYLVYEFMPLGSFEDCLYKGTIASLSLVMKAKIAVGIARGMVFLQKKKNSVKSSVKGSWIDRHKTFLDEEERGKRRGMHGIIKFDPGKHHFGAGSVRSRSASLSDLGIGKHHFGTGLVRSRSDPGQISELQLHSHPSFVRWRANEGLTTSLKSKQVKRRSLLTGQPLFGPPKVLVHQSDNYFIDTFDSRQPFYFSRPPFDFSRLQDLEHKRETPRFGTWDSDGDNDDDPYNPWSCEASTRSQSYDIWSEIIAEYELNRYNILLDEDFMAKLSNFKITDSGHLRKKATLDYADYYPGGRPRPLQNDFSGFAVVFAEVLVGRKLPTPRDFEKIEDLLRRHGKTSLLSIAEFCFKICNEADSESRMLTILYEYKKHIPKMMSLIIPRTSTCA